MQQIPNQHNPNRHNDGDSWFLIDSLWGAFRRHFFFAFVLCLPLLALVGFSLTTWKPEYASTASVVYDASKGKETQNESSLVLGNRIASTFESRFDDEDFLEGLTGRLEAKGVHFLAEEDSKIISTLKAWVPKLPSFPINASKPSHRNKRSGDGAGPNENQAKIEALGRQIKATTVPAQFHLSISAVSRDAAEAQIIARESILYFVEEDLLKHRAQLQEKLQNLNSIESSTLLEKADPKDMASTQAFIVEESVVANEEESKLAKTREQALINQILLKQKESVRAQAIQYEKEFTLQSELNALLSKRGAAHPDVIQKRLEIVKFRDDVGVAMIESILVKMKKDLYQLQAQMRAKGIPIDRSVQLNNFSDEVRRFLLDVSNQIRNVELEIESDGQQLQDPTKWVRYNLIKAAELPTKASNIDKLLLRAAIGIALVGLGFFLIILVRDMNYPWIVESTSLPRRYKLPVLVKVPRSKSFLNVDKVRKLRARLGDLRKGSDSELRLLDSYRYLQQLLKTKGDPQVICFYDLGSDSLSAHVALNLANVMATDSHERIIYLSFNPANQKYLPRGEGGNLMSFLSGEIDWKACRIKANETVACDLAIAEHPELQLGSFRVDLVQRLLKALREKYQRVIIDGLNPVFMNENTMLANEADVILVGTTMGTSKHKDLERLLSVTPKEKVQGFVLV